MLHVIGRIVLPSNVVFDAVEEAQPMQGHNAAHEFWSLVLEMDALRPELSSSW